MTNQTVILADPNCGGPQASALFTSTRQLGVSGTGKSAGNPPFLMPCTPIFLHGQVKLTVAEGMSPAAAMTALGHKRKSSRGTGMSAFGGKADIIRAKADIPLLMSGVGGKADINFGRLDVCF